MGSHPGNKLQVVHPLHLYEGASADSRAYALAAR
jgi:hypothetical protein